MAPDHFVKLITLLGVGVSAGDTSEDDKIVGGYPTGLIPFMVSVQRNGRHFCGGTLLSYHLTLTACHCLGDLDDSDEAVVKLRRRSPSSYLLQVGDWFLYVNNEHAQRRTPDAFHEHPDCAKIEGVLVNDFGLMEVKNRFIRTAYVRPYRLPSVELYRQRMEQISRHKERCWVIGWGKKNVDPNAPHATEFLKKAEMHFISDSVCGRLLAQRNRIFSSYNFSNNAQICAVGVNWGESDCTGDSGGPVWCKDAIMAIVSYGYECGRGDLPAVYAKIEHFLEWYSREDIQKIKLRTNFGPESTTACILWLIIGVFFVRRF